MCPGLFMKESGQALDGCRVEATSLSMSMHQVSSSASMRCASGSASSMLEAASLGAGVGGAVTGAFPMPMASGEVVEIACPLPGCGVAAGVGAL